MRKSTLFISAVLTTFIMATLTGVVSAYQNTVRNDPFLAQKRSQPSNLTMVDSSTSTTSNPNQAQPVNWTGEQAADLAAQVLGRNDLYSVEVTDLNGETVYLVTFSSGDLVYISMDGQIRSIGKVAVQTVLVNSGNGGSGNSTPFRSVQHHDDDHHENEHEGYDDD